jgi:hypothetical protein
MSARDLLHTLLADGFAIDVIDDGALLVSPASRITAELRQSLRACKPELLALLTGPEPADVPADEEVDVAVGQLQSTPLGTAAPAPTVTQRCTECRHHGQRKTCLAPLAAGLLTVEGGFGIVWPPEGHGAACPAYTGKEPRATVDRPHRLTNEEADKCHAPCWDDAAIAAFTARAERFALLGRTDAEDLAERLTLRDRDGDDRRLCLECTWLGDTGRCLAAATGRIPGADRWLEPVQNILQRCAAFGLRKGLN